MTFFLSERNCVIMTQVITGAPEGDAREGPQVPGGITVHHIISEKTGERESMLKGKNILLGISGSISAYKMAHLASLLKQNGAETHVIMTKNACRFIDPVVFDTLTGNRTVLDDFDRTNVSPVSHIDLPRQADAFLIAPASADIIAKAACGIADDMLSSAIVAAYSCPVLIAPAMNVQMLENPAVQENLEKLKARGFKIVAPGSGYQACGDFGSGRLPEGEELYEWLEMACGAEKDLAGKRVLVTAGATREAIDPVRFITNHSTGRMGVALARAAAIRGAEVTLVAGDMRVDPPQFCTTVRVTSAREMFEAVTSRSESQDIIIMAAAVADFRPKTVAAEKIKKKNAGSENVLELERTDDILAWLGAHKREGQFLCGFAMETQNLLENAEEKLKKKNADMIVANSLRAAGAGFGTDTNIVTFLRPDAVTELPILKKTEVADRILDRILGS